MHALSGAFYCTGLVLDVECVLIVPPMRAVYNGRVLASYPALLVKQYA